MARAEWRGAIRWGIVNVPVTLRCGPRAQRVQMHFVAPSGERAKIALVDPAGAQLNSLESDSATIAGEFPRAELRKGTNHAGEWQVLTAEELKACVPPSSKVAEIKEFVPLESLDPLMLTDAFYIAPDGTEGESIYVLLLEALRQTGRAGIARLFKDGREHTVAILPGTNGLILYKLYNFTDMRETDEFRPSKQVKPAEFAAAVQLIEAAAVETFEHAKYTDTYRANVEALLERKKIEAAALGGIEAAEAVAPVGDLMATLTASLAAVQRKPVAIQMSAAPTFAELVGA